MGALTHQQVDDFVEATLNSFKRKEWVDIAQLLNEYHFASRAFNSKKKPEKGGSLLEWKLRVDNQGNAMDSGLYSIDDIGRKNVLSKGKQGWSKQVVGYTYDIDEDEFQSDMDTIVNYIEVLENGLMNDYFAHMETRMWTAPSSSTLSPMRPAGIPFWFQKNATEGFNGGDPTGWSDGAGNIATETYPKWKNYTGAYVTASFDDLIAKVVRASDKTYFKAPAPFPEIGKGPPSWGYYTTYDVYEAIRATLQAGNDNIGNDAAKYLVAPVIRGIAVEWVDALGNSESEAYDSQAPFYGINWKKFEYFFKSGRNMVKHPPEKAPNQLTVRKRQMDSWGNFVCYDRRQGGFVFYKA